MVNSQLKERVFIDTANQINLDFKKFEINLFSIQHQVVYQTLQNYKDNLLVALAQKCLEKFVKMKICNIHKLDKSIDGCQTHSHNNYIQVLTETGIFGLIFFILIYIFICYQLFIKFLNYKKNFDDYEIIEIFFLISFFINLWPIMPTGSIFNNWINVLYFLPVGFYLFSKQKQTNFSNIYK